MPETYGLPEPEPTPAEKASEAFTLAVAGQSIVRAIVLYCVVFGGLALGPTFPPAAFVGIIAGVLLLATDKNLA